MPQAEHVAHFVGEDLAGAGEDEQTRGRIARVAVEGGIVAGEAEDSGTTLEQGLAEDEIPALLRIQVLHGDGDERVGIRRLARGQPGEEVGGEKLAFFRAGVDPAFRRHVFQRHGIEHACGHAEVGGAAVAQDIERGRVGPEAADGQDAEGFLLRLRPHGAEDAGVIGEALPRLRVAGEPVDGAGRADGIEEGGIGLEGRALERRQA